jgi:redox-sensitive bicupin YhaK (pirin superfamily)
MATPPSGTDLVSAQARVERRGHAGAFRELGPGVLNRMIAPPDDLKANSPFVLLVEDFIQPQGDFHEHPHRGLETVTFVLSGEMEHGDHTGSRGVSQPGDVQWMTAGRGIVHGGRPANGTTVHALQLWLNLPNAIRDSAPGTREQRRAAAVVEEVDGITMRTYGLGDDPRWSVHPMTLRHLTSENGGRIDVVVPGRERMFLYVLEGKASIASIEAGAGDVVWLAVSEEPARFAIEAQAGINIVAYSGVPIDEAVVAGGPFVAGSQAELQKSFQDFEQGRFP